MPKASQTPIQHLIYNTATNGKTNFLDPIITMINRATSLLSRQPVASHFVKDEEAALLCVEQERQRMRAQVELRRAPRD